jgi:formylglycine-generating enzyme required for sulfatase activity
VEEVFAYRAHVDRAMERLLTGEHGALGAELRFTIELGLNHEEQHQELILTDVKHVLGLNPLEPPYRERSLAPAHAEPQRERWASFDGGLIEIGVEIGSDSRGFAFDNERPRHRRFLEPFELARRPVTCGECVEFVRDGGTGAPSAGSRTAGTRARDSPGRSLHWRRAVPPGASSR